jgi:hypothetical protein
MSDEFQRDIFFYIIICFLIGGLCYFFGSYNGIKVEHTTIYENSNYITDVNSSNYVDFIKNDNCACIEKGWDGVATNRDGSNKHCYINEQDDHEWWYNDGRGRNIQ